jgi:glycosyltransferase involved in cell wall biosynthesis
MRPDKGLDRVPNILSHLQAGDRKRISIAFAGIGDCTEIVTRVAALTEVVRRPSASRLSDFEIAGALAQSDLLIAPYPVASASGTVVLALSRGLRVVAYDTGALSDVVAPDGLVTPGDEGEFANRIMIAIRSGCGGPAQALAMWKERSLDSWMQCLNALIKFRAFKTLSFCRVSGQQAVALVDQRRARKSVHEAAAASRFCALYFQLTPLGGGK